LSLIDIKLQVDNNKIYYDCTIKFLIGNTIKNIIYYWYVTDWCYIFNITCVCLSV